MIVSFTVDLASGSYQIAAEPVSLAPGETLGVTVLCTDKCDGATGIVATTKVGRLGRRRARRHHGRGGVVDLRLPVRGSRGFRGTSPGP